MDKGWPMIASARGSKITFQVVHPARNKTVQTKLHTCIKQQQHHQQQQQLPLTK